MSRKRHTPGPWGIRGPKAQSMTMEAPEYVITPPSFRTQKTGYTPIVAFVDDETNARFIAAAPEMFAALTAINDELTCLAAQGNARHKPCLNIIEQVRRAIATADPAYRFRSPEKILTKRPAGTARFSPASCPPGS